MTGSLTVGDTSLITRGEQPASKGVPAAAVPFLTSSLWSRRLGKVSVGEVKRQSRYVQPYAALPGVGGTLSRSDYHEAVKVKHQFVGNFEVSSSSIVRTC